MSERGSAGGTDDLVDFADVLPPSSTFERIETNGIELHTLLAGDPGDPPVVLLHGFPEFWYGWRSQIPALVEAGYRVIAPDQRGYNRSDKPDGVGAYAIDALAADATGLLDALGYERARFVGHDWGAGVVWQSLLTRPERIRRAVAINVPHPAVFLKYIARPSQLRRSWYIFFFQIPEVPERAWRFADWRGLRWFIDTSRDPETFSEPALSRYRAAWERPGALTAMLNWYRALFRHSVADASAADVGSEATDVDAPTMVVWGMDDPYLHPGMAAASAARCSDGRFEPIEGATHWVQHEASDRVNELLVDFLDPAK